jgi:hypothetical protein
MKRRIFFVPLVALILVAAVWPDDARAIPTFARKYGFNCTMCHSGFPRLNDFGARYRENGYRLPGRESEERTVLESPPPIAARTAAGYDSIRYDDTAITDVSQFRLEGLDILSGGLLGSNIGYFVVFPPQISESRGVVGQDGTLEMANVVFARLGGTGWLNVRAGRFEPAYVAFSSKRQLSVFPYEIYGYAFQDGIAFSDTQSGVEVFGHGGKGLHYAAGILEGGDSNLNDDAPGDAYARFHVVLGAGEGQTAGHRIGLVAYQGKARYPTGVLDESQRKSFTRYGLDASLNFGPVNVAIQYLRAEDDKGFWAGASEDLTYSGGFAEVLFQPRTDLAAFCRYDRVNAPDAASQSSVTRLTAGARYYIEDQIALHAELSDRTTAFRGDGVPDATEKAFTVRLDFAF